VKIKKSSFLEFFHFNFLHNLKTFDVVSFLTPLDSRNLTTVKFLESALPQGESDYSVCVASSLKTCRGLRSLSPFPTCGERVRVRGEIIYNRILKNSL
jgi:hypothetical protein